jgi:hypothetical protein
MIRFECDRCGARLSANDPNRYIVKMEVYAAAGPIELGDVASPGEDLQTLMRQLAAADPDQVEDETYRCLRFDLCDPCRRELLRRPLG